MSKTIITAAARRFSGVGFIGSIGLAKSGGITIQEVPTTRDNIRVKRIKQIEVNGNKNARVNPSPTQLLLRLDFVPKGLKT